MGEVNQRKKGGCLRTGLILVVLLVSISGALLFTTLRSGLYEGIEMPEKAWVIRNVQIWDGVSDSVLKGLDVVIESGEIVCVGCPVPAGADVIDAKGKSLLPGLIDMHFHFYAPSLENANASKFDLLFGYLKHRPLVRQHLHQAGVTAIRSVGDVPANILRLRNLVEIGEMEGPDVFCAGPVFTTPGGHPASTTFGADEALRLEATREVAEVEAARRAVAALAREGVDGIHIEYHDWAGKFSRLPEAVLQALVDQAKTEGLWTAVSTGNAAEVEEAIAAGATTVERGSFLSIDSLTVPEQAFMLIPTLGAYRDSLEYTAMKAFAVHSAEKGIPIGSGTHIQTEKRGYANSLHEEMEQLVAAGISPEWVLKGATSQAATFLKVDHYLGSIEAGKRANLILVEGEPWKDIADIRKISMVIQGGRVVYQPQVKQK